jgi:hypothetical protein
VHSRSTGSTRRSWPVGGPSLGLLDLLGATNVTALVADRSSDGAIGNQISAFIFATVDDADSFGAANGSSLRRGNVVVLVRPELDDLDR